MIGIRESNLQIEKARRRAAKISNVLRTPVVAYNVPGLRDSVIDGKTRVLVKDNSPQNLADRTISLLTDRSLLKKYSDNALAFSTQFSWDNTASAFDKIIREITSHP
jgi:glycosyltransferase involved in cell wall biosynthesis